MEGRGKEGTGQGNKGSRKEEIMRRKINEWKKEDINGRRKNR